CEGVRQHRVPRPSCYVRRRAPLLRARVVALRRAAFLLAFFLRAFFADFAGARRAPVVFGVMPRGRAWRGSYTPSVPPPGRVRRVSRPQPRLCGGVHAMPRACIVRTNAPTSAHMR